MIDTSYMFEKMVGQSKAKSRIAHLHKYRYQPNRTFENILLIGGAGLGKTEMAHCIGRGLYQTDETGNPCLKSDGKTPLPRPFFEINCSSIKSITQFINSIIIPKCVDREATLFLDEIHNIPPKVAEAFLTMFAPSVTNKTSYVDVDSDYVVELDFTKLTVISATTDHQKLTKSLRERFVPIELESYSISELAEILEKALPNVQFEEGVLEAIAPTVRCNPRNAVFRSKEMKDMVEHNQFGFKQWNELKQSLSIYPLGLSPVELSVLRILQENPNGVTLSSISAQTGISKFAIQQGFETYLQMQNLMEIHQGTGRALTAKGRQYLHDLDTVKI